MQPCEVDKRRERTRTHPKTSFSYNRLQSPWICVISEKGSRRASARLRAFSTSGLDHELFARFRHKTGFGMSSNYSELVT